VASFVISWCTCGERPSEFSLNSMRYFLMLMDFTCSVECRCLRKFFANRLTNWNFNFVTQITNFGRMELGINSGISVFKSRWCGTDCKWHWLSRDYNLMDKVHIYYHLTHCSSLFGFCFFISADGMVSQN
jgi:hypothetical protein